jgi:hypothetical protein
MCAPPSPSAALFVVPAQTADSPEVRYFQAQNEFLPIRMQAMTNA